MHLPSGEIVGSHRPLVAPFAAHHPVALGGRDRALECLDDLPGARGTRVDKAVPAPPVAVDVVIAGAEDVVTHRPGVVAVALAHRPVTRVCV